MRNVGADPLHNLSSLCCRACSLHRPSDPKQGPSHPIHCHAEPDALPRLAGRRHDARYHLIGLPSGWPHIRVYVSTEAVGRQHGDLAANV